MKTVYPMEGVDRIAKKLLIYGLGEKEAKIYAWLISAGPSKANEVAKALELNRMDVYRALKKLQTAGLVNAVAGRPARFEPVPVKKALNMLIEEARRKVREMEERRKQIVAEFSKLTLPEVRYGPRIRVIEGRVNVYRTLEKMYTSAEEEICLITTVNDLYRMTLVDLDDVLRKVSKRGVAVRILTNPSREDEAVVKAYTKFSEVKATVLPTPLRMSTSDSREAVVSILMDDSMVLKTRKDVSLWTDGAGLIGAVRMLFEEGWRASESLEVAVEAVAA